MTAYKKDPKKVAAGYAGAAARIKNQQVFLDKKRDAKHAETVEQLVVPSPMHWLSVEAIICLAH